MPVQSPLRKESSKFHHSANKLDDKEPSNWDKGRNSLSRSLNNSPNIGANQRMHHTLSAVELDLLKGKTRPFEVIEDNVFVDSESKSDKEFTFQAVYRWFSFLTPENMKIVILCFLWYFSSAFSSNVAKEIFQTWNFPVTLTYVQFIFVALYCFIFGFFTNFFDPRSNSYGLSSPIGLPMWVSKNIIFHLLSSVFLPVFKIVYSFWKVLVEWISIGLGIGELDSIEMTHSEMEKGRVSLTDTVKFSGFSGSRIHIPTVDIFLSMMPLSLFLISGHVFSSIALSYSSVSFVHTLKALSPLFTVFIFRFFYGLIYSHRIYVSLMPLTIGVMFACSHELTFSFVGFFCSLISTLIFVNQNIFSKKMISLKKLDKLNMLFYSSLISYILMTPIWYFSEGHSISDSIPSFQTILLFFLNGVSHFLQNVFAFSILSQVSPVTYSIASLIKRIVVIVVSIVWFGQSVSILQGFGIFLTVIGLLMYQNAKRMGGLEKRRDVVVPLK